MACHRGPDGMSPVSSMAVTVRHSSVVGPNVIWLPYFQSCLSAPDVSSRLEVGNNNQAIARYS